MAYLLRGNRVVMVFVVKKNDVFCEGRLQVVSDSSITYMKYTFRVRQTFTAENTSIIFDNESIYRTVVLVVTQEVCF